MPYKLLLLPRLVAKISQSKVLKRYAIEDIWNVDEFLESST